MTDKELLDLGFKDNSFFDDGIRFTEFELMTEKFKIEITGISRVEIKFPDTGWIGVPNCNTIEDLKLLIKLFL